MIQEITAQELDADRFIAVRNRCGAALYRADNVEVDYVAGIPDSGVGHAIGYAAEAGLPYRRSFVKYTPTCPRSSMPQDQRVRDLVKAIGLPKGKLCTYCWDGKSES